MNAADVARLVISNLIRMKLRVAMTSAGVIIGTVAVVLLVTLGLGLQQQTLQGLGNIGELTEMTLVPASALNDSSGKGDQASVRATPMLSPLSVAEIQKMPGVRAASPLMPMESMPTVMYKKWQGFGTVTGVDPLQLKAMNLKLQKGSLEIATQRAVIGGRLAEYLRDPRSTNDSATPFTDTTQLLNQRLNLSVGKITSADYTERKVPITVVGVLSITGTDRDTAIYIPINDVLAITSWQTGRRANPSKTGYSSVLLYAATLQDATRLETEFASRGFIVNSALSLIRDINNTFASIQLAMGAVGAISLLVAGCGIANTMMMAIYERQREIGVMKAVGATDRDVLIVFLSEASIIGLMGGLLGCSLAVLLMKLVEPFLSVLAGTVANGSGNQLVLAAPLWLLASAIALSTLVGLMAGVFPALKTTRLDPITALRTE